MSKQKAKENSANSNKFFCPYCWAESQILVSGHNAGGSPPPKTYKNEVSIISVRTRTYQCDEIEDHRWQTEEVYSDPQRFFCKIRRSSEKGRGVELFQRGKLFRSIEVADPKIDYKSQDQIAAKAVRYLVQMSKGEYIEGTRMKIYESKILGECVLLALYYYEYTEAYIRYLSIFYKLNKFPVSKVQSVIREYTTAHHGTVAKLEEEISNENRK